MNSDSPDDEEIARAPTSPRPTMAGWWEESTRPEHLARAREALRPIVATLTVVAAQGLTTGCADEQWLGPANTETSAAWSAPRDGAATISTYEGITERPSISLQRDYGWNFGTTSHTLRPMGTPEAIDAAILDDLPARLTPHLPWFRPYYVPTLFESVSLAGNHNEQGRASLRGEIYPVGGRGQSQAAGRTLAEMDLPAGAAVIVDLPGLDSVAFAAGMLAASADYDAVFVFDNWPHPFGIVPAQATLDAVLHYAQLFEGHTPESHAAPVFVLDRNRLSPYQNAPGQFDNRYVARLPSAAALRAMGVSTLVYVYPDSAGETDDLHAAFLSYDAAGITLLRVTPSSPDDAVAWRPERRTTMFEPSEAAIALLDVGTTSVLLEPTGNVVMVVGGGGGSFGRGWGGGG